MANPATAKYFTKAKNLSATSGGASGDVVYTCPNNHVSLITFLHISNGATGGTAACTMYMCGRSFPANAAHGRAACQPRARHHLACVSFKQTACIVSAITRVHDIHIESLQPPEKCVRASVRPMAYVYRASTRERRFPIARSCMPAPPFPRPPC